MEIESSGELNSEYRGTFKMLNEERRFLDDSTQRLEAFYRKFNRSMTTSIRPVYYRQAGGGLANNGLNASEWLGLSWTDIGFSKPRMGTALNMTKYADFSKTLQIRTTFTREQIHSFNLEDLSYKSYIQVGEGLTAKYFRPTSAEKDDTVAVLFHDGQRWIIAKITELTMELGKTPNETALNGFFRNFHPYEFSLDYVKIFSTAVQV